MHCRFRKHLDRARAVACFNARFPSGAEPGQEAAARLLACLAQGDALEEREAQAIAECDALTSARWEKADELSRGLSLMHAFLHAAALAEGLPELRVPTLRLRPDAVGAFLRDAGSCLALAARHEELLRRYHMPPAMVQVLTRRLAEAEDLHRRRAAAAAVTGEVAQALTRLVAEITIVLHHLDALNRLRFTPAPERLTEWRAALTLPRPTTPDPLPALTTHAPAHLTS